VVLAAERWVEGEFFFMMNADNLYPVVALMELVALFDLGLLVFDFEDLIRSSNIPLEWIRSFAFFKVDDWGYLVGIIEKFVNSEEYVWFPPSGGRILKGGSYVSMNCWCFDECIFSACCDVL